jgi:hypothetical protein
VWTHEKGRKDEVGGNRGARSSPLDGPFLHSTLDRLKWAGNGCAWECLDEAWIHLRAKLTLTIWAPKCVSAYLHLQTTISVHFLDVSVLSPRRTTGPPKWMETCPLSKCGPTSTNSSASALLCQYSYQKSLLQVLLHQKRTGRSQEPGRHFCTPFHAHELKKFFKFFKNIHMCSFYYTSSMYKISNSNYK